MAKLTWDATGERLYETGVDRGVLYPITTGSTYLSTNLPLALRAILSTPITSNTWI